MMNLIETICMIVSIFLVLGLHFAIMVAILNNINDIATALKERNKIEMILRDYKKRADGERKDEEEEE